MKHTEAILKARIGKLERLLAEKDKLCESMTIFYEDYNDLKDKNKDLEKEIERLNQIAFGETKCDDCCNAIYTPLIGCGLTTEQWRDCTGDNYHYYWNKKDVTENE